MVSPTAALNVIFLNHTTRSFLMNYKEPSALGGAKNSNHASVNAAKRPRPETYCVCPLGSARGDPETPETAPLIGVPPGATKVVQATLAALSAPVLGCFRGLPRPRLTTGGPATKAAPLCSTVVVGGATSGYGACKPQ